MANQTKFVSNIPNNKLEPVYLGGAPENNTTPKSNGVFVPSILRGEKDTMAPKAQVVPQINEATFPSLLGTPIKTSKPFLGYANALKKAADISAKPVVSTNTEKTSNLKPISKTRYSEYSDSDSEDSDNFLDDRY